jgi:hypothetical protein
MEVVRMRDANDIIAERVLVDEEYASNATHSAEDIRIYFETRRKLLVELAEFEMNKAVDELFDPIMKNDPTTESDQPDRRF